QLLDVTEATVREHRQQLGIRPVYKRVDTCAAEFASSTAYLYSTYEESCESEPTQRDKIMVLGGGPNRIGQGIEFDYCCVHAALAMREDGYETIMVNCNPETVSTDYDTSDRLYFEPLTLEDVLEIVDLEQPKGIIVHYGGQTPLKLAQDLEAAGAPIIGTSPDSIDLAEDRERFQHLVDQLGLKQPPNRTATNTAEALTRAAEIGFPLVVRPSYVLGGRAMEIVHDNAGLERYMRQAVTVSNQSPVLLDRFLDDAIEVDIDAICDGEQVLIGPIMEHIEQAGVHSGDSACSLPPYTLSNEVQCQLQEQVRALAHGLKVVGLMNTQFAIKGDIIYLLEVNPRASRTVPFVSKAIGMPLAKIAARCMAGTSLATQQATQIPQAAHYFVKEAVFPFNKFPGVDTILGPEMKSTGEVMGVGDTFGEAFAKAMEGSSTQLPRSGHAFISVRRADRERMIAVARNLSKLGFSLAATRGTARILQAADIPCTQVNKVAEGRPHVVDQIKNGEFQLIINTTEGKQATADSRSIRATALQHKVSYTTTLSGAEAIVMALQQPNELHVNSLNNLHSATQIKS
ncbi:MAG: carbamoyl-phosphate synthase large subunit, partial [Pseudomonadota bacterium]